MPYSTAKCLQEVTHKDWLQMKLTQHFTVTAFWTSIKIFLRSLFTPRIKSHPSQEWQQRGYLPSLKGKAWKGSLSTRQTTAWGGKKCWINTPEKSGCMTSKTAPTLLFRHLLVPRKRFCDSAPGIFCFWFLILFKLSQKKAQLKEQDNFFFHAVLHFFYPLANLEKLKMFKK